MVTHLVVGEDQVACGRNDHNTTGARVTARVTCRACRGTHAFTQAKRQEDERVVNALKNASSARPCFAWQAWQDRLQQIPGENRLPRCSRRLQRFV